MTGKWPGEEPQVQDIIFTCHCGAEAIRVEFVNWDDWKEVWIAFWEASPSVRGWRTKWHHIKRILKYGHPYADMVTLEPSVARALANAILVCVDEIEKGEKKSGVEQGRAWAASGVRAARHALQRMASAASRRGDKRLDGAIDETAGGET